MAKYRHTVTGAIRESETRKSYPWVPIEELESMNDFPGANTDENGDEHTDTAHTETGALVETESSSSEPAAALEAEHTTEAEIEANLEAAENATPTDIAASEFGTPSYPAAVEDAQDGDEDTEAEPAADSSS